MSDKSSNRPSASSILHAPRAPRALLAGGLAAFAVALPQVAFAADRTWTGGGLLNNNWGNNSNWAGSGGISPLDSLFFGGTSGLTNNNNTAAGTQYNGLTFNSGAGAFVLGGNWIRLGGNVTNNSTATQTINFGMELVGADRTFNAASGDLVLNGSISGNQGIVKTGAGTLWLGGANTYSGGTTINGGTVDVASSLGLGTGQVTFGGTGTLVLRDQASAYANAVQVSAGKTAKIDTAGNSVTFGGAISGAGTFEKVGAGTLRLAGANTSTGGTKLTDGLMVIENYLALGNSSNALTVNGGTLDLRNASVYVGALSGTGGVITTTYDNGEQSDLYLNTTVAAGTTSTFSGSIQSGSQTLIRLQKEGAGTLVLNGANDMYDAQINAGTLEFGRTDALAYDNFIGNGATLRAGVGGTVNRNVEVNSSDDRGTFDTQNFAINLSGSLVGGGTLVKSGSGTLRLSGWNANFWGSFEINAGTLEAGGVNAFDSSNKNAVVVNTGTFDIGSFDVAIGALSGGSAGRLTTSASTGTRTLTSVVNAGTSVFDGVINDNPLFGAGKLRLVKDGAGTLQLGNTGMYASNYSGGTAIWDGTLAVVGSGPSINLNAVRALGRGDISIYGDGALRIGGNAAWIFQGVKVYGNESTIDVVGNLATVDGIAGSGNLVKKGAGTLVIGAIDSIGFSGSTYIDGGSVSVGGQSVAGRTSLGYVDFRGDSTLLCRSGGSIASGLEVNLGVNGQVLVDGASNVARITGSVDGYGNRLEKTGAGTLKVDGNYTFRGLTRVSEGTLSFGTNIPAGTGRTLTGGVQVSANGTFDVRGAGTVAVNGLELQGGHVYSGTLADGSLLAVSGVLGGFGTIDGNLLSSGVLRGALSMNGDVLVSGQHFAGNADFQTITGSLAYDAAGGGTPSVSWSLLANTSANLINTTFDQVTIGGDLLFNSATAMSLDFGRSVSSVDWSDSFWSSSHSWTIWQVAGSTTGLGNLTIAAVDWRDAQGDLFSALRAGSGFSVGLAGNGRDVVLSYTAVPAPGALALLALAGLAGGRRRRGFGA